MSVNAIIVAAASSAGSAVIHLSAQREEYPTVWMSVMDRAALVLRIFGKERSDIDCAYKEDWQTSTILKLILNVAQGRARSPCNMSLMHAT